MYITNINFGNIQPVAKGVIFNGVHFANNNYIILPRTVISKSVTKHSKFYINSKETSVNGVINDWDHGPGYHPCLICSPITITLGGLVKFNIAVMTHKSISFGKRILQESDLNVGEFNFNTIHVDNSTFVVDRVEEVVMEYNELFKGLENYTKFTSNESKDELEGMKDKVIEIVEELNVYVIGTDKNITNIENNFDDDNELE